MRTSFVCFVFKCVQSEEVVLSLSAILKVHLQSVHPLTPSSWMWKKARTSSAVTCEMGHLNKSPDDPLLFFDMDNSHTLDDSIYL